jgi:hypothetical protein
MNELVVDCSLYEGLIKSDLPEILNGQENRLDNLRYLVLTALAPCDPQAVAKTRFSLADLQRIAANLRFDFENTHVAPRILEKVLAPAKLVAVSESEGKPRYYYSITEDGLKEVVNKMDRLRTLAQVVDLGKKLVLSKKKRIDKRDLPSAMGLLGNSVSLEDLDSIKEDIIRDLQVP